MDIDAKPPLPALGSVWTYRQLDQALQDHASAEPFPFHFALVDLDVSDEDAPAPETLTLRCTESARPKCAFKIGISRVPGDKASLWRVDTVDENHTHWQSVFADPQTRQEAIELSERHRHEDLHKSTDRDRSTTPPDDDLPSKPMLWQRAKPSAEQPRASTRTGKQAFRLIHKVLPHVLSIEEWQSRTARERSSRTTTPPIGTPSQQGSSKDLESDPFSSTKPRPAPLLLAPPSPSKLISPSFTNSQYPAEIDPSHPFSARLPPDHRPDGVLQLDKGKGREEDEMEVDGLSPRTVLLNAVNKITPAPIAPDTPLFTVQPGIELIVGERPEAVDVNADAPAIPVVGSRWASREAFKEACQKHAEAMKPPFGFTTPTSSATGVNRFIIYACRHNRKGGGGCPYLLRCQAIDPSPDAEWIVTDTCYRHANHQVPSPPLRLGWGLSRPHGPEKRPADVAERAAYSIPAKRVRASTPPLDRRQPLDTYLPALHPALSSSSCLTALHAVGIDGTETLSSLTPQELAVTLAGCGRSLTGLQRAVLTNRLANKLEQHPRLAIRPGRRPRTVQGVLHACHPTMFPKEGDGAIVARLLHEAGVPDSETFKALEPEELVEILRAIETLSVVQSVVIVNRIARV